MKKVCIIFLLSIIISLTAFGIAGGAEAGSSLAANAQTEEYLRIHIRADSNADSAQAVKYLVRDAVVDYLTPYVAEYETQKEARAGVRERLSEIERVAKDVLSRNGFPYGAKASIRVESFPTRVYGEYTLPAGEYVALILELGRGEGDNWWCVVYPPLCFSAPNGENVIYKSKIAEIIQKWRGQI